MLRASRADRPWRVALALQTRADAPPGPRAGPARPVQDGTVPLDRDLSRARGPGAALWPPGQEQPYVAVHTDAYVGLPNVGHLFCPGPGVGPADQERRQRDDGADCDAVCSGDCAGDGAECMHDVFLVLKRQKKKKKLWQGEEAGEIIFRFWGVGWMNCRFLDPEHRSVSK